MKKKILILALLFMGCESFGVFKHEHEHTYNDGKCVYESTQTPIYGQTTTYYECFQNYTRFDCSSQNWIPDTTCEEYCSSKECDLNSNETIEGAVGCECTIID